MENKSNTLLKVTGILMIIGGAIGIIGGIIAIIGVGAFVAMVGGSAGILIGGAILVLISAIVSLIAGIQGVKNADKPENANVCIMYGSIVIGFTILGSLLNVIGGKGFSFSSLLIGLVLPGLYLYGAFQNKKLAEGNMIEA